MCDTPTDVAVRIQSDYDDLVEFARALASKTTYEEFGHAQPDVAYWDLSDWHDAQIEQARSLCDALGVFWEGE